MSPGDYGWLVLGFPLLGTIVLALGWRVLPGRSAGWIGSASILASFLAAVGALVQLQDLPETERHVESALFDYTETLGISVELGILVDPLSVLMMLVVSGVSFLIHLYSVGYMASDRGYVRFFAYLNFFVFSMLLLVLAGNFILLTIGWAFVGAASYLLISFWYRRETATSAGIKAFVMNVIGDVGLVVAAFLLFDATGALDYAGVFEGAQGLGENDGQLVAACICLLVGAFAKSAQIPLHTWLPDAMEGPTPVSALIHAATMVTAGVYLIARAHPLFELAPTAADVAAVAGTLTLLVAATIALVVTDLKRVIAYSTMSQIGYMVLGVSAFAYGAGLFHLMTHAFFKALLFMSAGSVIAAMGGVQSLDRMGGFRKAMPFTFVTFTIGAFALAGFPLFSGFFSKDEIIAFTLHRGGLYTVLGVVAYVASFMTAFYAFRMVFRVFFGPPVDEARTLQQGFLTHSHHENPATGETEDTDVGFPGPEHEIAEQSRPMSAAMAPLALLSIAGGIVAIPGVTETLEQFLEPAFEGSAHLEDHPSEEAEMTGLAIGAAISVVGILLAWGFYVLRPGTTVRLRDRLRPLHDFLAHKWYFDELYDLAVVRPGAAVGRFGATVVESVFVQDVLVGGSTAVVRAGSSFARGLQTGYLRSYALLLVAGLAGLGLYFLIASI
ncbi:MAG TPA: NADH-quinone oxidoreductase subunit L [Thermoleophilaceae bacterium]|nr:NADH-quinone oxidoreductase subunit L [Thermoleophilaceae bacterium]